MSDLRDYLSRQVSDLSDKVALKQEELRGVKNELSEARRALAAVSRPTTKTDRVRSAGVGGSPYPASIKDMVRQVLGVHPSPISPSVVQALIRSQFGVEVTRTSLSPQLSRLVADGEISSVGGFYKISDSRETPGG